MVDIEDRLSLVYLMFFYLSVGMLLPWNFFINVNGYWMHKFRSVNATSNNTELNELQLEFTADLAIAAMVPNVLFLVINGLVGHRFRIFPRILVSLILIVVLFTVTLVLVYVDTDAWQSTFLIVTLATTVLINVCNGIFQGGIFGLAGMFPPRYMNAILTGQGLGGVFAAVINILLLLVGDDEVGAAFYCFLFSVVFLAGSIVTFISMSRTKLFKHFTRAAASGDQGGETNEKSALLTHSRTSSPELTVSVTAVLKSIWEEEVTVFLIYLVTLACFPALTVLVQSSATQRSTWTETFFVPVCCFLVYNLGDYLGRTISAQPCLRKPGSKLCLIIAVLRIVFIPLLMVCNAAPDTRTHTPILISSDPIYVALMTVFAISNGYLTSVVMVSAPRRVESHQQETAANLMAGILGLGLATGAALSALLVQLL